MTPNASLETKCLSFVTMYLNLLAGDFLEETEACNFTSRTFVVGYTKCNTKSTLFRSGRFCSSLCVDNVAAIVQFIIFD